MFWQSAFYALLINERYKSRPPPSSIWVYLTESMRMYQSRTSEPSRQSAICQAHLSALFSIFCKMCKMLNLQLVFLYCSVHIALEYATDTNSDI